MNIYFVTTNKGKYEEIKEVLTPVRLIQVNTGYPEIQTQSLEDVVRYGLEHITVNHTGNFLIEDSGLAISSLQGFPGVYSAYIFNALGIPGILKLMQGSTNRKATFKSVIGFREATEETRIFKGACDGKIAENPKGEKGFGYDPIFIPKGSTYTFAEMTKIGKNSYSHRGKAADQLKKYLLTKK